MADGADADGTDVRHPALIADEYEAELLARFSAHRLVRSIEQLEHSDFLRVLLQRRFLSLQFPVMYDIGIDGLADPGALTLAREILREEYPDASGCTPSHREDLVSDLLVLGATKQQVLASRPTSVTTMVVEETLALILDAARSRSVIGVLTILRFWGEVLVSVEYGEFWGRMETLFLAAGVASRFYHPHHHHDGREQLATAMRSAQTHSGRLGACLAPLLATGSAVAQLTRTEDRVLGSRLRFYDQFVVPEHLN